MNPDKVVGIQTEEKLKDNTRYVPTGKIISRQVIGISVVPVVTEYHAVEFLDKKKGRNVHSAFPDGVTDDVNYDESMKAVLFLLNSRCNVSLEKTAQFISNITDGALSPCVGMISGLCREFSLKSKKEQDSLFKALLDAPVMRVDGTSARINANLARTSVVIAFIRYLQRRGLTDVKEPDRPKTQKCTHIPHAFTVEELTSFFYVCDYISIQANRKDSLIKKLILCVIFRYFSRGGEIGHDDQRLL